MNKFKKMLCAIKYYKKISNPSIINQYLVKYCVNIYKNINKFYFLQHSYLFS